MAAPEFWQKRGMAAWALSPFSVLFGAVGAIRRRGTRPRHAGIPVVCVGNLVAGGAGKTPVVLALIDLVTGIGARPHILTRGYGGSLAGPIRVDRNIHNAAMVGDEALLLGDKAPTWVARDRRAGAAAAEAAGAEIILMDDGMQNPSLYHDWDILVVDGEYGFGNGMLMPAGPLREDVAGGLARARFVILMGTDRSGLAPLLSAHSRLLEARLVPKVGDADWAGRRVIAFAGIGRPAKFFATLEELGIDLVERVSFPDHHPYRRDQVATLLARARSAHATLVTTEKDWVRLPVDLRDGIATLPVTLAWNDGADAVLVSGLADLLAARR